MKAKKKQKIITPNKRLSRVMEWINTIRTWTDDPATDAMLLDIENEIVLHVVEEIEREIIDK